LIALRDEPLFELPPPVPVLDLNFGDQVALAGYRYGETGFQPAQVVPLTLYWRALDTPVHDYSVSLRLIDGVGDDVYKIDSQHPVLGMYPTSKWEPGEVVADYYEIQLPPDLPTGTYRWGVILYRALPEGGWESLKVNRSDETFATGGEFEVTGR
jgi:hypothetical protein